MKMKKLRLPIIILAVTSVLMFAFCVITSIAKKPVITEQDFPFIITYELNGKTETIEDIYHAYFVGNDGYVDKTGRVYEGKFANMQHEDDVAYVLTKTGDGQIVLHPQFYADYLMGDTEYDYFQEVSFEPILYYYDEQYTEYADEESLLEHGVKLISWEYPEPIENSFTFSHIAPFNGDHAFPMMIIAAIGLLAVMILVKRSKKLKYKTIDKISIASNILAGIFSLPMLVLTLLFDAEGSSAAWNHQMAYFMPGLTVLCLAASIALRRKGFRKAALIASWIGPVVFVLLVASFYF